MNRHASLARAPDHGAAESLLGLLVDCSGDALAALREERWPELSAVLQRRDELIRRCQPLLEQARLDAVPHRDASTAARATLLRTLRTLQAADETLASELGQRRNHVGAELDSLARRSNEGRAYLSEPASAGKHLNLIR